MVRPVPIIMPELKQQKQNDGKATGSQKAIRSQGDAIGASARDRAYVPWREALRARKRNVTKSAALALVQGRAEQPFPTLPGQEV